jgi:hypothetical protein
MKISKIILDISLRIILVGSFIVCALLVLSVGWEIYGISTDRGGLNYNFYTYYGLSKTEILFRDLVILIIFSFLAFFQILALKKGSNKQIIQILIVSIFAFLLLTTYEIYLDSRFVPKG